MPPPKTHAQPKADEVAPVLAWIAARVDGAEAEKRTREGRTVLRRLNRAEYQNTMRDLLGVGDLDLKDLLPPDASLETASTTWAKRSIRRRS
jgi:hypothetical protein